MKMTSITAFMMVKASSYFYEIFTELYTYICNFTLKISCNAFNFYPNKYCWKLSIVTIPFYHIHESMHIEYFSVAISMSSRSWLPYIMNMPLIGYSGIFEPN